MRFYFYILILFISHSLLGFTPGEPTLLVFSGSDWCIPCINFERNVLSTETFKAYSQKHLKVIKADFPQRTTLPGELVTKNEKLAERYNPQGVFPLVLLLNANGDVSKKINTTLTDPALVIQEIESVLSIAEVKEYRKKLLLMGSSFEFTLVHQDARTADSLLNECVKEVQRIEALISEWDVNSEVSKVNQNSGTSAVTVSREVYQLIDRSLTLSDITHGAFDISFRGINLYDFDQKNHSSFPDTVEVEKALQTIGYTKIQLLENQQVMLSEKGMAIGFGASGKGYAADKVKQMMQEAGVTGGVINASGDLTCWGYRADGTPWKVGISNPDNSSEMLYWLPVHSGAVATSGSYEKYFEFKGKRYSHIINPITGFPVSDKKSVTVFSNSAELSDALATALFVMDIEAGLELVQTLPNIKALIIDENNHVHHSKNLDLIE